MLGVISALTGVLPMDALGELVVFAAGHPQRTMLLAYLLSDRLALGEHGLKVYEETSKNPECRDLDSRVVYRHLGGREDWRGDFPEEVEMKREETRKLLRKGREAEEKEKRP